MPRTPTPEDLSPTEIEMPIPEVRVRAGMSHAGVSIREMTVSETKALFFPKPANISARKLRERLSRIAQHATKTKGKPNGLKFCCRIVKRGVVEGVAIWRTA